MYEEYVQLHLHVESNEFKMEKTNEVTPFNENLADRVHTETTT